MQRTICDCQLRAAWRAFSNTYSKDARYHTLNGKEHGHRDHFVDRLATTK